MIKLNNCLNQLPKFYGLSLGGSICGAAGFVFAWLQFTLLVAAILGAIAFTIGSRLALSWHVGDIQKWLYWNLPSSYLFGSKCIPSSSRRFKK